MSLYLTVVPEQRARKLQLSVFLVYVACKLVQTAH
jgi:hypothetical protein